MNTDTFKQLPQRGAALMSALADPTRKAIFNMLLNKALVVKVIAADLPVSPSAVSQHLKIMREAGLVLEEKLGRERRCSVNPVALDWLSWQFSMLRDEILEDKKDDNQQYDAVDMAMEQWNQQWSELDTVANAVILRLFLIGQHLGAHFNGLAAEYGMTSDQVSLLSTLDRIPTHSCRLHELVASSFSQPNTGIEQIETIAERGYINIVSEDTNGSPQNPVIKLTEQGMALLHTMLVSQKQHNDISVYKMTPEELIKLAKLLRLFSADIGVSSKGSTDLIAKNKKRNRPTS